MPVCPTGYTLTSFRPCPISDSSLITAKMPELSKKSKLKKSHPRNIEDICFFINLHLGMWQFLPIKICQQESTGGKTSQLDKMLGFM